MIERAVILCDGDMISPDHFIFNKQFDIDAPERNAYGDGTLESVSKEALKKAETQRISEALRQTKGNKTKAAEILQVSYKTLLTKIKEYGIEA